MLEEDIRDILFEAGYTKESIENVMSARLKRAVDKSVNSTGITESDLSESEPDTESAFDILRKIRVENVNKTMIGTLNINSGLNCFSWWDTAVRDSKLRQ